ncbi:MAG: hypothetical protein ABIJ56_05015 [Pseudomonadota bacterium]
MENQYSLPAAALLLTLACAALPGRAQKPKKNIDDLYGRIAHDLGEGRPLVLTAHVALCDNDFQGIVKVKNPKICNGEKPGSNLYWGSGGGLKGYLAKEGWKNVLYEETPNENLAVKAIWKRTFKPGKNLEEKGVSAKFDVFIVGLGYRGVKIRRATIDFLKAVHGDGETTQKLGDDLTLSYGGASHLVGYIGHNYFLDITAADAKKIVKQAAGESKLHKGVFALSCLGDALIKPAITSPNAHILMLNKQLTYPGAWTVGGILKAIAAGKNASGIHHTASKAFAEGKKKNLGAILNAFSYGD